MSIEIVTGYQGRNHVTSNDVGGFQQGVVGTEDYVFGVGEKAKATLISNNSVRISDGEIVMQGVHWRIKPGTYENVTINNGNQGMKRKDAIVARYKKDSSSGIENITLAVLQGTPTTGTPVAPAPTTGDIRLGALKHEMILYIVELNGLNVVGVDPAFKVLMSMYETNKYLSDIRTQIEGKRYGYANDKGLYITVSRSGKFAFIEFAGRQNLVPNQNAWSAQTLWTLPEEYWPKNAVPININVDSSDNLQNTMIIITTDGKVNLQTRGLSVSWKSLSSTHEWRFAQTYMTKS